MKKTFLLLLALLLPAGAAHADLQADLDSLVAAERAFSRTSEEQGMKPAFLAFMADDSILFRPGPVNGRKWTEERPAPTVLLTWRPVKADIAKSGDLGYTTGPWEARAKGKDDPDVAHGQYVTVWKKRADGSWKLVTDIGNVHPKPESAPAESLKLDPAEVGSRGGAPDSEASLLAADRSPSVYADALAGDARVLRNGAFPVIGREAVRGFLKDRKMTWEPLKGETSRAGDFGYTYGTYEETPAAGDPEKGHYLRIWKRQGGDAWKLLLDITNPLPPPPKPAS